MKVRTFIITALLFLLSISAAQASAMDTLPKQIDSYKAKVWYLERIMHTPLTTYPVGEGGWVLIYPRDLAWELRAWKITLKATTIVFRYPPNYSAWMCIHHGEGAWNDPNPPFWGGLQMDSGFQATYGAFLLRWKGTADHWAPLEQIWTAEFARASGRGFYPWPNTARVCGLI